ncbi:MAG: BamA/TamA family outer membrane protein [Candidatus Eisenbacteria bacterium]
MASGGRSGGIAKDGLPGFESLHLGDPNLDVRGDRAAFVALSKGRDEVVVVSLPGGEVLARRRFEPLLTIESLALSPDGREAVVAALHESGRGDLFHFSIDGGPLERLTDDLAHETGLDWGEEGILFVADREKPGRYDLHRIDPAGNEARILHLSTSVGSPRWTKENGILYLTREMDRPMNVHLFDPVAGTTVPVTRDAVGISALDVDGDTLYLRTNRKLRFRIWKTALSPLVDPAKAEPVPAAAPPVPWIPPEPVAHEKAPYRRKYGPDIFFLTGNAFYSQTLLGFSDILGDRKIALFLGSNANRSDDILKYLSGGLTVHFLEKRTDYRLGGFHIADEYLTDRRGFFFRRETGILGGLTYPLDRFRSIGVNLLLKHVREEPLGTGSGRDFGEATVQGILGYDTAVPDRFGYGFGSGVLSSLLFSTDLQLSPERTIRSNTVLGDLRFYFPFPWDITWANRLSGGFSSGEFPEQILIGGSLTLRGYDYLSLRGDRYLLANEELRFPLPLRVLVGDLAVVSRLQGALFLDAGDAWFEGRSPLARGSAGFGLRNGIGGAVLRWDLAKKFERRRFQEGWETDFFIGWNF